ncbi:hypothetical protein [Paenibacillus polymyxa]|uniref:hypothetical protein n=1 Tax=Paenibacillus polymyxa TaxID=1406 RepID=UPI000A8FADB2|nr:hypothetical protein [Paenibacillus polymyxa]
MIFRVFNWLCAAYWLCALVAVITGSYTLDRFDSIVVLIIVIINFVAYGIEGGRVNER